MNKNIKLAVAGAVLAMSASAANAGIIIPAGDWTLDVNGNVNGYVNFTKGNDSNTVTGGLAATKQTTGSNTVKGINTGLLPAWLGFTGKTRQNDLDVNLQSAYNQVFQQMISLATVLSLMVLLHLTVLRHLIVKHTYHSVINHGVL